MSGSIVYIEEGVTERDRYWYIKGKREGFVEGSQALIELHSKIEMLKLNPDPSRVVNKEDILIDKEEV